MTGGAENQQIFTDPLRQAIIVRRFPLQMMALSPLSASRKRGTAVNSNLSLSRVTTALMGEKQRALFKDWCKLTALCRGGDILCRKGSKFLTQEYFVRIGA